jgi:hypothetical protein
MLDREVRRVALALVAAAMAVLTILIAAAYLLPDESERGGRARGSRAPHGHPAH